MQRTPKTPTSFFAAGLLPACFVPALFTPALAASPQDVVFSIDYHGPTIGIIEAGGTATITNGDLLTPTTGGGTPVLTAPTPPTIFISHTLGGLGLPPACVGMGTGAPCPAEVDALSFGVDNMFDPVGFEPGWLWFGTDANSFGPAGMLVPPNTSTEGPVGDTSADMYCNVLPMPSAPMPPFATNPNHVGVVDGDGLYSGSGYTYPGVGLIEPNPTIFAMPQPGDTMDACSVQPGFPAAGLRAYFSLDMAAPDPLTGLPNSATAPSFGYFPGDILVPTGGIPAVWAPFFLLGLGPNDDIDALIINENGSGFFEPSSNFYDWMTGGTDMVIFSVRRGSPIIGMPDSALGLPIEEGDLLTTPLATAFGGLNGNPAMFVAAENLGLGTVRSGTNTTPGFGEELNSASAPRTPLHDCNSNGWEDAVDIAFFGVADVNQNGIPDPCELLLITTSGCFCPTGGICGTNPDPIAGCANQSGTGALMTPSGSTSVTADNLTLTVTNATPANWGLFFMGSASIPPVFLTDGLRCVGGSIWRYTPQITDAAGTAVLDSSTLGTGIVNWTVVNNPPAGQIMIGSQWTFQFWYRDPIGGCGLQANLSNSVTATFY